MNNNNITQAYLRERLDYNPETGEFTWKARAELHPTHRNWNRRFAGQCAGNIQTNGYRYISLRGKLIPAHRLAWIYQTGSLPPETIDHINNIRSDNRWENLRSATQQQNTWNRKPNSTSTSTFKGVSWSSKCSRWISRIQANGTLHHLGSYLDEYEAHLAYERAASQIQGEFQFRGAA